MQARLFAVLFILSGVFCGDTVAEEFAGWYQIDVILFKPSTTDLDAESWPDVKAIYPVDVVSVSAPDIFKLSQLEQLEPLPGMTEQPAEPVLRSDEFLFQNQSRSQNNLSVIEAMTGSGQAESENSAKTVEEAKSLADLGVTDDQTDAEPPVHGLSLPEANPLAPGSLAYSRMDETSSLNGVARSLRRSSRFELIDHRSWIQPVDGEPTNILVQAGDRFDDSFEIEGTLAFSRSRYLHVQTSLRYTVFEPKAGGSNPFLGSFDSSLDDETRKRYPDLVEVERQRGQYYAARNHQMIQSRRMRSNELHYLDHPLFGAIIRINRFKPDPETLAASTLQN